MIRKRNTYLIISIILLCTLLLVTVRVKSFINKNDTNENVVRKQNVINTYINANKFKYCDIIKITSKYGLRIKKLLYKDSTWDVVGCINGKYSSVKQFVNLLQKEQQNFDIYSISGDNNNLNVEIELKIK
ncbi:MAG: hypothetical protein SPJ62_16810 [Inconstantimicrobium porci]|uniref:Uncharacterized protein n=1 Tax=Inconstantimicrobium porci TaxID=2652291 RepID=A0A7X2SZY1_9CLOT|nr:hypothetical protein [Inconstantimicrobium porci]MDD6771895.1 hypothetical protein [Inconstantimicrobium porci]MDY5913624.1 hypothetical protein [Inconstantimicrobium porci]MSR90031.1 hypothetical protein [Inconstantimicrobium porci]